MAVPSALQGYGPTVLAVSWMEFGIAFILLIARIYTTIGITRNARIDLYLALLTFVSPNFIAEQDAD